jgi:metal transporter CNNM
VAGVLSRTVAANMISTGATATGRQSSHGYTSTRSAVIGLAKILVLGLGQLSMINATPIKKLFHITEEEPSPDEPSLWIYLSTAVVLVLLGGAFAGLTIAYVLLFHAIDGSGPGVC